jgi:hypothetical protein
MKAILTIVYEKELIRESEMGILQRACDEGDEQLLTEEFGIGWDSPKLQEIKFV